MKAISGWNICRLMRKHKMTIRGLASRMNITMKRVREVRQNGVAGHCMCLDWYEAITGTGIFLSKQVNNESTEHTHDIKSTRQSI